MKKKTKIIISIIVFIILVSLLLFVLLSGCSTDPEGKSPEDIAEIYFNRLSNEKIAEMVALKYEDGLDYNFCDVVSVNLISCEEDKGSREVGAKFELPPDKVFFMATNVDVTFEIKFKNEYDGDYCESGIYKCVFILVKEKAQSGWESIHDPGVIKL